MAKRIGIKQFRINEIERVKTLTNKQLYEDTIDLGGGDDYDVGCFTAKGAATFCALKRELDLRLAEWLEK